MKGLLLKEIYVWFRTRSFFMLYLFIMMFIGYTTSIIISVSFVGVLASQISAAFLLDEKSGWQSYWKTLPCTPLQRVTAKYAVTSVELFIGIIACIISSFMSQKQLYSVSSYFSPRSAVETYSYTCLIIAVYALFLAIQLPICFKLKGTKRTVLSFVPSILFVFAVIIGISGSDDWYALAENTKWLPAVIVIIGFVFLAISFVLSVIFESNTDTAYKKKFKNITIVLTVIAVVMSAVVVGIVVKFSLEQKNKTENVEIVEDGYNMVSDYDEIKNDFDTLYGEFCGEFHLNITVDECTQVLASMGYFQNQNNPEKFFSESGKINLNLTSDTESGKVIGTHAYSNLTAEKELGTATKQYFNRILLNFYKGMTQDELHEKFNELQIFPYSVSETLIYDNQPRRIYVMKFSCDNYEGVSENSVSYKIEIITDGEAVVEIEDYLFRYGSDGSLESIEDISETVLEKGEREATEYINDVCNENNLNKTTKNFVKKLKNLGFTESQEAIGVYYSKDGKVSVSFVTDDDNVLKEISAIVNYGEMHYIESATEKEMTDILNNFTVGMTENQLQQKLSELEMFPDSITEKLDSDNKHLRVYKITYRIGDYDGSGAATWSVIVEVTDGKVTGVLV